MTFESRSSPLVIPSLPPASLTWTGYRGGCVRLFNHGDRCAQELVAEVLDADEPLTVGCTESPTVGIN
jgi:hypothetical protein